MRHFSDYALSFLARIAGPDLQDVSHEVIAKFLAHGFAGAIKAWLSDPDVTKEDLVDAAVACAPACWAAGAVTPVDRQDG
ncbi:hypothetical protein [Kitasatospora sp. GAS1066B]|uniref:hypothetical protein n=1 Tax=Kitasatospora sp. GAS1066B TaxID=3156271 RepID=UPI0035171BFA